MLGGEAIGELAPQFRELEELATAELVAEGLKGVAEYSLDVRYAGQGYELNVAWDGRSPRTSIEEFHELHRRRYGFCDRGKPVQIVNLRLRMTAAVSRTLPGRTRSGLETERGFGWGAEDFL